MDKVKKALDVAIKKTDLNISNIGLDLREFPGQYDGYYFKGERENYIKLEHVFGWTQSFFTGMGYWAYKVTHKEEYLKWLNSFYDIYYKKVFETPLDTMHDLGFLYIPYAVAIYKLTNDQNMKKLGIKAADELAKRFIPNGGYIRAWGRMDNKVPDYVDSQLAKDHFFTESKGLAIIDCMMNLPLLFWASETTGNPYYKRVATAHADTTLKYFIRDDDSVYHAYRFDEETGEPIGGANYCGYSTESYWARGTAWAIYGFIIAYHYTNKKEYLDISLRLSRKFINLCEEDGIPIWDFRLPEDQPALYQGEKKDWLNWDVSEVQNIRYNRDSSATAIALCGFYQILENLNDTEIENATDKMLTSLVEDYTNYDLTTPGLLSSQNGSMLYTCYGDYFYMEALTKKLHDFDNIWLCN